MLKFDLHLHTVFSDGTASAEEAVVVAAFAGAKVIAITDHDTVNGVEKARTEGSKRGVVVIAGTELSAEADFELHLLGYDLDPRDTGFAEFLRRQEKNRAEREGEMILRLRELGMIITADELHENPESLSGRTHIARILVQKRYVPSIKAAFDRLLSIGRPAYVPRRREPPEECIRVIREAGGMAVWAHPGLTGLRGEAFRGWLDRLTEAGLGGLEAFYPSHSMQEAMEFDWLARQRNLLSTYGSDWHGEGRDTQVLEKFSQFPIPEETVGWVENHLH